MQALHDVVKAGYVRYIGMSSCYAYQCLYLFRFVSLRELTLLLHHHEVHKMQSTLCITLSEEYKYGTHHDILILFF